MLFPGQIARPQSHPYVVPEMGASIREHVTKNSTLKNPILENQAYAARIFIMLMYVLGQYLIVKGLLEQEAEN